MLLTKQTPEVEHEHIEPQNADLALIRQYARREVKEEEVYVGAMHAANTKLDRAGERFTKAYLQRFAQTLPGKPTLEGHDTSKRPNGRIYKAEVLPDGDGWFLKTYYYVRADSPLVTDIELGIAKDVSIGYRAHRRVCDLDGKEWHPYRAGKDYCEHEPLEEYDGVPCTLTYCDTAVHKAEGMEMSWVWVGAQRGAEAIAKSFDRDEVAFLKDLVQRLHGASLSGTRSDVMPTIEEVQAELQQTKAAHEKALGEAQKQLQELKRAAEDGEWGRKHLASEILRMAALLGEGDYYGKMLELLGEAPTVKQLEPLWEIVGKKFDERFPPVQAHVGLGEARPAPRETQTEPVGLFRRRRLVTR